MLLADEAGELIESNLLLCLNEPAEGDFSWVKPGKTTFHWWNGTVEHGPPSTPETNFAIHKKYIDFCARNKIAYHSVISVAGNRPWFVQSATRVYDSPHAGHGHPHAASRPRSAADPRLREREGRWHSLLGSLEAAERTTWKRRLRNTSNGGSKA